ncbi:Cytochrome P450 [Mycena sanguinolenta]|uniref:Cytochrome P450 n=1 Tax=Mycena sanguinolenta TaxID=230812 RepID=A0A8H6U1R8_9AGAR|nr:Cytochrome P450 [Mycena sanguinolenta]
MRIHIFTQEVLRVYPAGAMRARRIERRHHSPFRGDRHHDWAAYNPNFYSEGDHVALALASYQRLPSLWGDDADVFNPYRWIEDRVHQGEAIGPYANLLSFFGGPARLSRMALCRPGNASYSLRTHPEIFLYCPGGRNYSREIREYNTTDRC